MLIVMVVLPISKVRNEDMKTATVWVYVMVMAKDIPLQVKTCYIIRITAV